MNDQLSGQLCGQWTIPQYARSLLWLDTDSGAVAVEGEKGLFTLPAPADTVTVRWGGERGPALARLRWRPDSLEWDGLIRIGGTLTSLHLAASGEIEGGIAVLHLAGFPLRPEAMPYASARDGAMIAAPDYFGGIDDALEETVTTWIATDDSPPLALAQDALVTRLSVWCFGRLTADKGRWHERFALPIWLSEMTVFAG